MNKYNEAPWFVQGESVFNAYGDLVVDGVWGHGQEQRDHRTQLIALAPEIAEAIINYTSYRNEEYCNDELQRSIRKLEELAAKLEALGKHDEE